MAKTKNLYFKKAKKAQILGTIKGNVNVKGNKAGTAIITIKDLLLAVLGGRFVAATTGTFSIPAGVVITALGHYFGDQNLQALGIGTMAANNQKKSDTVAGIDGLDGVKERVHAYKASLMEDLFINKLLKKKTLAGVGDDDVLYFNYPNGNAVGDLSALDNIENQLIESGMQFQGAGDYEMEGIDDPLY